MEAVEVKKTNPFYKERNLKKIHQTKTFKISTELLKDYNKHFKSKYPDLVKNKKLNDNQILTKLLLNYLNKQCLERKEFNIDVLIAISKSKPLKLVILAIRDDYIINKYNNKYNNTQFIRLSQRYLDESKIFLNLNELYEEYFKQNYFTKYYFNKEAYKNYEEFETIIETQILTEAFHYDYNYILLRVNNYLDEFQNGVYTAPPENYKKRGLGGLSYDMYELKNYLNGVPTAPIIHKGIGKAKKHYFTYKWSYNLNHPYTERLDINNIDFEIISENKFNHLIQESTNNKLKNYSTVKTEYNPTITTINLEDENTALKKELYELMKNKRLEEERMKKIHDNDIKKLEKIINNLMENNEALKTQLSKYEH